ncbi:hypothetical protein RRG08_005239 [Elysia crispata]|uniref:Uncharacterized protein n=1 Tax=Elysia crispata TaxID=231223 RepID=A0AAE1ALZ1_9GAST|nr:hypothetical protein RRG08_005239 [Elysia crispata]
MNFDCVPGYPCALLPDTRRLCVSSFRDLPHVTRGKPRAGEVSQSQSSGALGVISLLRRQITAVICQSGIDPRRL